jgi:hypothetical protein
VMTNSRRKTPICGKCYCDSEKEEKRKANRQLRSAVKRELLRCNPYVTTALLREVSKSYFGKDGKIWLDPTDPENRKDLAK